MRTSLLGGAPVAALLIALSACGGSSVTGPGGSSSGSSHLRAKIDGATWNSTAGVESVGVPLTLPGVYSITGTQLGTNPAYTIAISLYNIGGRGTYPLGVGPTVPGGTALVSDVSGGWSTPLSGAAGTLQITALTDSRIAGTFSFTAAPVSGGVTGTKTVTEGDFDLTVKPTGTVGPLPDNAGNVVSATIDGASWNAATVASSLDAVSNNIFALAASNTERSLTINLNGVTGPGTFSLGSSGAVGITNNTDPLTHIWSTTGAGGSGTVTITSITDTRIQGTFSATLGPAPGTQTTGTVTITNGTFDVSRPTPP